VIKDAAREYADRLAGKAGGHASSRPRWTRGYRFATHPRSVALRESTP
jgi:hypothetical protein